MVASKAIPLMQSKVRCYIDKSMFKLIFYVQYKATWIYQNDNVCSFR